MQHDGVVDAHLVAWIDGKLKRVLGALVCGHADFVEQRLGLLQIVFKLHHGGALERCPMEPAVPHNAQALHHIVHVALPVGRVQQRLLGLRVLPQAIAGMPVRRLNPEAHHVVGDQHVNVGIILQPHSFLSRSLPHDIEFALLQHDDRRFDRRKLHKDALRAGLSAPVVIKTGILDVLTGARAPRTCRDRCQPAR